MKNYSRLWVSLLLCLSIISSNVHAQLSDEHITWTPETGITFNGQTDYILVENGDTLNLPTITVEAWIRFESTSGNQIFLNRGAANEAFTFYHYDGKIRMLTQDQSGNSHANAPTPPANGWFHCVGTFDQTGTKKLYYNGVLQSTERGVYRPIQSTAPLTIGAMLGTLTIDRLFHGQMENIRIWNRALPQDEIIEKLQTHPDEEPLRNYRSTGLRGYWSSRSLNDNVVQDLSGNGNHGKFISEQAEKPIVKTTPAEGYQGIWYSNQPSDDKYRYKYSGGLGTYCAKHRHHAHYVEEENKTFFVYGGTKGVNEPNALLIMISYFDHDNNQLARPVVIQEKGTSDAHHNPVLSIDAQGHLWVFASAHGGKDGFIWRSTKPYDISEFEMVLQKEFTYPQPHYHADDGFLFIFTKYTDGREMYASTSADGYEWSTDKKIAGFGGHYQISEQFGNKYGTSFNWHPPQGGLNARTNLYYMETRDGGETWTNVQGDVLETPLDSPANAALVRDYHNEEKLVYMKDIIYDQDGNPAILYNLSKGYESGPENGPREFTIAHWQGDEWQFHTVCEVDHNYDTGSLWMEVDGTWKVIAPTGPGPQEYCTGGEVALWESKDQGRTWQQALEMTNNSPHNHTYVRRVVNGHPDFYAIWADGDGLQPSESKLYYCNQAGDKVWVMPEIMTQDFQKADLLTETIVD